VPTLTTVSKRRSHTRLQHRHPRSAEAARHVPAVPRCAAQPRLRCQPSHGMAGGLHRCFCAPVSSLSACQGPLMSSEWHGPSGRPQSSPISGAGFFPSRCFVCKQVTSRFHNITFPGQRCPQTCHSCLIGEPLSPAKSADRSDVLIHCTFLNKGGTKKRSGSRSTLVAERDFFSRLSKIARKK